MSERNPFACQRPQVIESLLSMDNLHHVKLEEIPELLRWVEVSRRAGHMSEEKAREWRVKIGAWRLWLELHQGEPH